MVIDFRFEMAVRIGVLSLISGNEFLVLTKFKLVQATSSPTA